MPHLSLSFLSLSLLSLFSLPFLPLIAHDDDFDIRLPLSLLLPLLYWYGGAGWHKRERSSSVKELRVTIIHININNTPPPPYTTPHYNRITYTHHNDYANDTSHNTIFARRPRTTDVERGGQRANLITLPVHMQMDIIHAVKDLFCGESRKRGKGET